MRESLDIPFPVGSWVRLKRGTPRRYPDISHAAMMQTAPDVTIPKGADGIVRRVLIEMDCDGTTQFALVQWQQAIWIVGECWHRIDRLERVGDGEHG